MCRILQPAAENLIYRHQLDHNDDLDDIVLRLERYLNQNKKQRLTTLLDPGSLSDIPANAEAGPAAPQTHDNNNPNMPTVGHENDVDARSIHTLEGTDCSGSNTTECAQLKSPTISEWETT